MEKREQKCKDIEPSLVYKELPAHMIVNNYIKGEKDCNPEKYLRDYINKSSFFKDKSNGEVYKEPVDESDDQCDAHTDVYSVDFKTLLSCTKMEAKSVLSVSITKCADGWYSFGEPQQKNREMECSFLWAAVRYRSIDDFERIERSGPQDVIEKDIFRFLKNLRVKKNIILFLPVEFSYSDTRSKKEAIEGIERAIYRDFQNSIKYREKNLFGCDTYLATIYDDTMIFFELCGAGIRHVDSVSLNQSEVFMKLKRVGL